MTRKIQQIIISNIAPEDLDKILTRVKYVLNDRRDLIIETDDDDDDT